MRVVVLSGEGESFCAGLDFSSMSAIAGAGESDGLGEAGTRNDGNPGSMQDGRITHLGQQICWVWQELPVPVLDGELAVELFIERARRVRPSFEPTAAERAELGDDVLGDDPTTLALEERVDLVAVAGNGRAFKRAKAVFDVQGETPVLRYYRSLAHMGWPLDEEIRETLREGEELAEN